MILSPGIILPSLEYPQYLDNVDMLESLAKRHTLFIAGNIRGKLPFAREQISYAGLTDTEKKISVANKIFKKIGSTLLELSNNSRIFSTMRNRYEKSENSRLEKLCYSFFKKHQIDVFYAFPFYPDVYHISVANRLFKPIICEFWEDQVVFNAEIMHNKGYDQKVISKEMHRGYDWFKYIITSSSQVIVPSQVFKVIIESLGFRDKVSIAHVCANLEEEKNARVRLRQNYSVNENIVIYYSSSLSAWQDLDTLLNALRLCKQKEKMVLVVIGNKKILDGKIRDEDHFRVISLGNLNQHDAYLHLEMADICVAPYKFHYKSGFFPGKIVRYMMAGKAVIATDLEEVREVLNGTGLLITQCDSQGFANALDYLVDNGGLRERLGRSGKEVASRSYTWENHSDKIIPILESLVKNG